MHFTPNLKHWLDSEHGSQKQPGFRFQSLDLRPAILDMPRLGRKDVGYLFTCIG